MVSRLARNCFHSGSQSGPRSGKRKVADDGAAVQLRRGEVDHGARLVGFVLEELPDDLLPHPLGAAGQRRVEVEHRVLAAEGRAGDEHVPGQDEHAEPVRDEQLGHAAVVLVAPGRARDAELLGLGPARPARQGDGGDAEAVDQVEEAVALRSLAALAVAEDGADLERDLVLLRAGDDVREQVGGRLVAAGGEPADPHQPLLREATPSCRSRSSARRSRHAASSG